MQNSSIFLRFSPTLSIFGAVLASSPLSPVLHSKGARRVVAFTPFTLNERAREGGADTKDMLAASESEQARQAKKTTFGTSINDVRKMFHLLDPPFPLVHMLLITSPHF